MKKSTLLLLAVMFVSQLMAQSDKYKIGFKVSPNIGWVKPDTKFITNDGSSLRFGFGLITDIHFTDNYAIGTGLNIFQTGGKVSYFRQTNEEGFEQVSLMERTYKLQYGEIPLTLKLRTNEIGYITYWGQFGLGLGVNIRAKSDEEIDYRYTRSETDTDATLFPWEVSSLASRTIEDEDIKNDISLFRASLIMGAGIEYNISGTTSILAGITFNNGFTDALLGNGLQKDDRDEVIFEGSGTNRAPVETQLKGITNFFELNLGIMF
jgi:hypothetical protein